VNGAGFFTAGPSVWKIFPGYAIQDEFLKLLDFTGDGGAFEYGA